MNLEEILKIARTAAPLQYKNEQVLDCAQENCAKENTVRIGVMRDRAFSFYYPENLEALEHTGAKLVPINSMEDPVLPDVDGLYIGGGFPEVMAEEIAANQSLRMDIKRQIEDDMPVYAECGGLMFLSRSILINGTAYPMVGVFDCDVEMQSKPQGIGYTVQQVLPGNPFYPEGMIVRGHEFHNSKIVNMGLSQHYGFSTQRGKGIVSGYDGFVYRNTLAGYHHMHVSAMPAWANRMVQLAKLFQQKKEKNK